MDLHWKYHVIYTIMQTNYSRILRLLDFFLDVGAQPQKDLDCSKQPGYPLPDLLSAFHLQCVHPLQHEVLNSSLMACEWTRNEQGRPGAFSTRGIFSHTNHLAYYFLGSQDLWTADSPGLKDSWKRGYQGTSSRLERSEVSVIPTATTEKQIINVKDALLVHLLFMLCVPSV